VIKVGCRISTERPRIRAIARPEIISEANTLFKALGVGQFVFPVHKDQAGAYRLEGRLVKDILRWLDGPGNVLWLSITGRTRGNGLLEGDLRTGAALFSLKKGVPLVPMGLVTSEKKGKPRVIGVRFGEPIRPPSASELDDFQRTDYLIDLTKLAMCEVARLLPPGQRGDFEDAEAKLEETNRRLGIS
jgi:1-acyl-sn-glycerol-3-phosphate acyltransferase